MFPSCYSNDCTNWGIQKAYDGKVYGIRSLAHTGYGSGGILYFQYDLGPNPPNITAVRITARADAGLSQSQNLNVYLSGNTSYTVGNTLCRSNVTFPNLGNTQVIFCPVGMETRYVTVAMNTTANTGWDGYMALQEVTPLYDGA